jgi:hypothetical protein
MFTHVFGHELRLEVRARMNLAHVRTMAFPVSKLLA